MRTTARGSWWSWAVGLAVVGLTLGAWILLARPSAVASEGGGEPEQGQEAAFQIVYPYDTNGDGQINDPDNEFDYVELQGPVLLFGCKAEVTGDIDPSRLRWTIEDVGTIRGTWNPHVAGDSYTGMGLNPMVSFSGMPDSNAGFGRKRITLRCVGMSESDTVDIEVFFDPLARNNNGPVPDDIPPTINLDEVVIRAGQ